MKKRIIKLCKLYLTSFLILFLLNQTAFCQETAKQKEERMQWWMEARFGMFIHWGLYALPARHEWVKKFEKIPDEEYQKYFDLFNPDLYNPVEWAKAAKEAGMKYVVVTTKHHEGFCLWDSKQTDYKVTNTPYKKDLIKPLVDAFREQDLKVGFYYSLIDWHHPEYTIDRVHPMSGNKEFREKAKNRDMKKYVKYMHSQVREILTEFGKIDCLFLDYSYPGKDGKGKNDWESKKLLKMIRELQPDIIINDRLDLLDVPGGWDYRTPEQGAVQLRKQSRPGLFRNRIRSTQACSHPSRTSRAVRALSAETGGGRRVCSIPQSRSTGDGDRF